MFLKNCGRWDYSLKTIIPSEYSRFEFLFQIFDVSGREKTLSSQKGTPMEDIVKS